MALILVFGALAADAPEVAVKEEVKEEGKKAAEPSLTVFVSDVLVKLAENARGDLEEAWLAIPARGKPVPTGTSRGRGDCPRGAWLRAPYDRAVSYGSPPYFEWKESLRVRSAVLISGEESIGLTGGAVDEGWRRVTAPVLHSGNWRLELTHKKGETSCVPFVVREGEPPATQCLGGLSGAELEVCQLLEWVAWGRYWEVEGAVLETREGREVLELVRRAHWVE